MSVLDHKPSVSGHKRRFPFQEPLHCEINKPDKPKYPRLISETDSEMVEWKIKGRSYELINRSDLEILLSIARTDFNDFCERYSKYKPLKDHIIAICLCQGGALHYIDETTGIRDFDVYIFFDNETSITYPVRRRSVKDFGTDKFGTTYPGANIKNFHPEFIGRNIDLMARNIDKTGDYIESIQNYLKNQNSPTAYYLSQKAVVVLYPEEDIGKILWNAKKV
jgi:hypothetical protein